jgi:undecaprenyl-diphosphatase
MLAGSEVISKPGSWKAVEYWWRIKIRTIMLAETFKYYTLAVIQGLTEIFPVSSSGHLIIFSKILDHGMDFNRLLIIHLGTFLSILWFYIGDLKKLLSVPKGRRSLLNMGIGFTATAAVGFALKFFVVGPVIERTGYITTLMVVNGLIVLASGTFGDLGTKTITELNIKDFLLIGIANGIGTLPGISRLGWTLSAGMLLRMNWFEALKMSFFISLPTIFFGNLFMFWENHRLAQPGGVLSLENGIAILISFLVGWLALKTFSKYLGQQLLIYFGGYCVAAGLFYSLFLRLL